MFYTSACTNRKRKDDTISLHKRKKDAVYQSIMQTWYFDEDENRVNDLLRATN
jgi:hypothetical protein